MRKRLTTSRSDTACSQKRHDAPTALSRLTSCWQIATVMPDVLLLAGSLVEAQRPTQLHQSWLFGCLGDLS